MKTKLHLTDIVNSPKRINNGYGAWTGTLQELIYWEVNRWEGVANRMIQTGRLTRAEWEAEDFNLADYVERMHEGDVRGLADDPEATVTPN